MLHIAAMLSAMKAICVALQPLHGRYSPFRNPSRRKASNKARVFPPFSASGKSCGKTFGCPVVSVSMIAALRIPAVCVLFRLCFKNHFSICSRYSISMVIGTTNTTSVTTTKRMTVIAFVSIRETTIHPASTDTSSYIVPGNRIFILKSSGNFFMGSGICKFGVDQSDGVVFFLIDDFRVYLRGLHVRVTKQLADGIEVCAKCQHHRGERVLAHVIGTCLVMPASFTHGFICTLQVSSHDRVANTGSSSDAPSRSGIHFLACIERGRYNGCCVFCMTILICHCSPVHSTFFQFNANTSLIRSPQ